MAIAEAGTPPEEQLRLHLTNLLTSLEQVDAPSTSLRLPPEGASFFLDAAVKTIAENPGSAGSRRLVAMLARDHRFVRFLLDPVSCRLADALAVAHSSSTAFESELERELTILVDNGHEDDDRVLRILSLFEAAGAERRCIWFQSELLASHNLSIRSKAAKLLARGYRHAAIAARLLHDSDPRVQASAVESLWTLGNSDVVCLLMEALNSPHHRVAGNAAVGLYHIDHLHAVTALRHMVRHGDVRFRTTAVWAMGETGDARFIDCLTAMADNRAGVPRLGILRALSRIRSRQREIAALGTLEVRIRESSLAGDGTRHLRFSILPARGEGTLRALDIAIGEGDREIADFVLKPQAGPVVVGFVLPPPQTPRGRIVAEAVEKCRRFQRREDIWRTVNYRTGDRVVLEAVNRVTAGIANVNGQRHVFLVVDGSQNNPVDRLVRRIESRVMQERITLHAFLPSDDDCAGLRAALRRLRGCIIEEPTVEELPQRMEAACAALQNGYELSYRSTVPPAPGLLSIASPACGLASVEFEPTPDNCP